MSRGLRFLGVVLVLERVFEGPTRSEDGRFGCGDMCVRVGVCIAVRKKNVPFQGWFFICKPEERFSVATPRPNTTQATSENLRHPRPNRQRDKRLKKNEKNECFILR